MKYFLLILLIAGSLTAQDKNKLIQDGESGKPMLIGICDRTAFADTNFAWWLNSEYDVYNLDTATLASIGNKLNDYNLTVVMGSWCSDSRREVPRFYKVLDTLKYDQAKLKLICVNRDKNDPAGDTDKLNIEAVPTFIFYKDDKEIGRIVESPKETLEKDILKIVQ